MDTYINPSLGCDKPSVLLARMYAMKPDQHDLLHALFLWALPNHCVEAALSTKWEGRQQLGKLCDDIWARKGGAASTPCCLGRSRLPPHLSEQKRQTLNLPLPGRWQQEVGPTQLPPRPDPQEEYQRLPGRERPLLLPRHLRLPGPQLPPTMLLSGKRESWRRYGKAGGGN